MPKISKEEIMKAVERYKRGETSQKAEAKKQGVSHQTFEQFVHYYNHQRRQHKLNCLPPATYRSLQKLHK